MGRGLGKILRGLAARTRPLTKSALTPPDTERAHACLDLMAEWCNRRGVDVWAYCVMPNHVHVVVVHAVEQALRLGIGEAHRRHRWHVNFREGWRGHLWQGRFASYPRKDTCLYAATRYVEFNPARQAGIGPTEYRWSSE